MSDLLFNSGGKTHSLRLRVVDHKPGEVAVWEAMVDSKEYVNFEYAEPGEVEIWDLFGRAIDAWQEHRYDDTVEVKRFKEEGL